ncbi:MAG: ATP-binding protein [Planctomycetes bacterium]|nr:ATP-binding protein [Planctomycetota bacterium]
MKALVATENAETIAELEDAGVDVVQAGDLDGLDDLLEEHEFSFSLIDEALPHSHQIVIKIRTDYDGPDRDRLPVIMLKGQLQHDVRCLPDYMFERYPGADEVIVRARTILMRRARQKRLFDQELRLKARTTSDAADVVSELCERLIEIAGYEPEDQVRLDQSVREAIGNAAEHGNQKNPERTIHVTFLRGLDRVGFVIRDEGKGHDTEAFLARANAVSALEHTRSRRENEARPGGLGVFIMKETCDRIEFNTSGNAIYLVKYLPGHSS